MPTASTVPCRARLLRRSAEGVAGAIVRESAPVSGSAAGGGWSGKPKPSALACPGISDDVFLIEGVTARNVSLMPVALAPFRPNCVVDLQHNTLLGSSF